MRVRKLFRGNREPESCVERWVENIRSGAVALDRSDKLLVAPGNLDAGLELVALAVETIDVGNEDGGKTANFALVLAAGRDAVGFADEVEELAVNSHLGLKGLAFVRQGEGLATAVQEKLLDGRRSDTNIVITTKIFIVHIDSNALLVIRNKEVVSLVPLRVMFILNSRSSPLSLSTNVDITVAVGNILDELLE